MRFQQFKEQKQLEEFDDKFTYLCQNIALSRVPFHEFWSNVGMPTVLEGNYSDGDELLEGMFGKAWDYLSGPMSKKPSSQRSWVGQKTQPSFVGSPRAAQALQQQAATPPPVPQTAPSAQTAPPASNRPSATSFGGMPGGGMVGSGMGMPKPQQDAPAIPPQAQQKIDAATTLIKQELSQALKGVVDKMKQSRDKIGYQVADIVSKRLEGLINSVRFKRDPNNSFSVFNTFGHSPNIPPVPAKDTPPLEEPAAAPMPKPVIGGHPRLGMHKEHTFTESLKAIMGNPPSPASFLSM